MVDAFDADVLIVGGGPAGLSAGIFTARAGLETLVANALPAALRLPAADRVGIGGKLLLASVLILLVSFVMEAVFGVVAAGGIGGF